MKTSILITTTLLLVSFSSAVPASGAPCSAKTVIADHAKWLASSKNGKKHVVRATTVSNQRNRLASYAEGELRISGVPFPGTNAPTSMHGTLRQYFSDRTHSGAAPKSGVAVDQHPFSPAQTDQLELMLSSDGSISVGLKSWGSKVIKLTDISCRDGVVTAVTDTAEPRSVYVISFAKRTRATPALK